MSAQPPRLISVQPMQWIELSKAFPLPPNAHPAEVAKELQIRESMTAFFADCFLALASKMQISMRFLDRDFEKELRRVNGDMEALKATYAKRVRDLTGDPNVEVLEVSAGSVNVKFRSAYAGQVLQNLLQHQATTLKNDPVWIGLESAHVPDLRSALTTLAAPPLLLQPSSAPAPSLPAPGKLLAADEDYFAPTPSDEGDEEEDDSNAFVTLQPLLTEDEMAVRRQINLQQQRFYL